MMSTRSKQTGKTKKLEIPKDCPSPRMYKNHKCNPKCAIVYEETKFRNVSPLAIPFYLGWARALTNGDMQNCISYISPCGIRFSKYEEVHTYNKITRNKIPIDFFAFESSIDCLNEYVTENQVIPDLSYGKEWTPVRCVNSLNHELPVPVEYLCSRDPGKGLKKDLDDGFLACCDCVDDCSDKTKCACLKLTHSGISFRKKPFLQGYQNRRLKERVDSGIYECNRNCKCRADTCFNRVVQNKVKWPVEVFRTMRKGWGARALHDMPKGSFVCIYTGNLLSDSDATRVGLTEGDEYLADLDYVEVMERMKDGYESDCTDIENDDEPKPKVQVARKSTAGRRDNNRCQIVLTESHLGSRNQHRGNSNPIRYRQYFGKNEKPYIVDGKSRGNFGRYFNHSCNPNLFIQNIFVDTHDLRFPWVAFFTQKDVKAGTELCWDYNYEVGSVPQKYLRCECGERNCRGRLL